MERFSLNSKTIDSWTLPQLVAGCQAARVRNVALWRELYEGADVADAAALVRAEGLTVTSLCRGGFFPTENADAARRPSCRQPGGDRRVRRPRYRCPRARLRRSAAPGAGRTAGRDLPGSRQQVADAVGALAPLAAARGVRLAVEPLHPVFCADRSVISTLDQALTIAAEHAADVVGVCVDTYHLWWDDAALDRLPTIGERIAAYQVCDWLDPLPDPLLGRGIPGDGVIDFSPWTRAVVSAGYTGPVEVEIFNQAVWDSPGDEVLATVLERFGELIEPDL